MRHSVSRVTGGNTLREKTRFIARLVRIFPSNLSCNEGTTKENIVSTVFQYSPLDFHSPPVYFYLSSYSLTRTVFGFMWLSMRSHKLAFPTSRLKSNGWKEQTCPLKSSCSFVQNERKIAVEDGCAKKLELAMSMNMIEVSRHAIRYIQYRRLENTRLSEDVIRLLIQHNRFSR